MVTDEPRMFAETPTEVEGGRKQPATEISKTKSFKTAWEIFEMYESFLSKRENPKMEPEYLRGERRKREERWEFFSQQLGFET